MNIYAYIPTYSSPWQHCCAEEFLRVLSLRRTSAWQRSAACTCCQRSPPTRSVKLPRTTRAGRREEGDRPAHSQLVFQTAASVRSSSSALHTALPLDSSPPGQIFSQTAPPRDSSL
eukprot:6181672-Pleurochrysis_carterae.AAC.1